MLGSGPRYVMPMMSICSLGEIVVTLTLPRIERAMESSLCLDAGVREPSSLRSKSSASPILSAALRIVRNDVRSRFIVARKYLNDAAPEDIGRFAMTGSLRRSKAVWALYVRGKYRLMMKAVHVTMQNGMKNAHRCRDNNRRTS